MKSILTKTLLTLSLTLSFASASTGWVFEDGSAYNGDCCKTKTYKSLKAKITKADNVQVFTAKNMKIIVVKKPTACLSCDYSKIQLAKLYPVKRGEKLIPAKLGNCGLK